MLASTLAAPSALGVGPAHAARAPRTTTALVVGDSVAKSLVATYGPGLGMPDLAVQSVARDGCVWRWLGPQLISIAGEWRASVGALVASAHASLWR